MTPRVTFAVVARVLAQLRRDPRTVAMLIVLPTVLISLMWWMFIDSPHTFDRIGGPLLAVFPAIIMFIVTSVATLRERSTGTLSRLFTMPMGKLDFLLGYALAFALIAVVQALVVVSIALYFLDLNIQGAAWQLGVVAVLDGVLGTALGLFASAFAATEFQAVQMMPAVMIPQILLCGLLIPRDQLPSALHAISDILPLSYAVDAVIGVAQGNGFTSGVGTDALIVLAFILAALTLGAATLKRRTA
ncbi:MAG TPA: ABC transporter permease [Kribbella sp.]|jgi:ABC-2 type transport system permease protein